MALPRYLSIPSPPHTHRHLFSAFATRCSHLRRPGLQIPSHDLPWEATGEPYPASLASPLQILLEASNGASDYGNKFGEPLIAGFTRTFGQRLPSAERREWIKPIMFSGGFGQIDRAHHDKAPPEVGMLVVKIGGPAYRIGIGGGAASSVPGGTRGGDGDLDFNAVQRGDAEMSQKLWRVVRACVELGDKNPIVQVPVCFLSLLLRQCRAGFDCAGRVLESGDSTIGRGVELRGVFRTCGTEFGDSTIFRVLWSFPALVHKWQPESRAA